MFNSRSFVLLILFSSNAYCDTTLSVVTENNQLRFSQQLVSGSHQQITSHPRINQTDVFRFYIKGKKGKKIQISLPSDQTIARGNEKISINQFIFGCGLSSAGIATVKNTGITDLLCIGAKATVQSKHSPGTYSNSIPIEIDYL